MAKEQTNKLSQKRKSTTKTFTKAKKKPSKDTRKTHNIHKVAGIKVRSGLKKGDQGRHRSDLTKLVSEAYDKLMQRKPIYRNKEISRFILTKPIDDEEY